MLAQQILAMQEELEEVKKPESESEEVERLLRRFWIFFPRRWRCWSTWRRRTQWSRWSPPGNQSWRDQQKRFHTDHFSTLPYKHCMREQREKFHNNRFHFLFSVIFQFHIADCFHTERTYLPYLGWFRPDPRDLTEEQETGTRVQFYQNKNQQWAYHGKIKFLSM